MWIVAGLGNPGSKYSRHRHNIGFMVIEAIARHYHFPAFSKKHQALVSEGRIGTEKVLLVQPQTFMNLSGQSVGEICRFFKLTPEQLIVIHDELDLLPGKLRVKRGGSAGGHNGLKSIDEHVGQDYLRVRFGIGHPGHSDRVSGYVLSDFAKEETDIIEKMTGAIVAQLPLLLNGDEIGFMNKVALVMQPPREKPTKQSASE